MAVAESACLKRQQSAKSAFGIPIKSSTLSRIQPPVIHQVCYVTGGLAKLYQTIQDLGKDCTHDEVALLAKRYRFIKILGKGCSATLIQAVDTFRPDNQQVAIKVLSQEYYALGYQMLENPRTEVVLVIWFLDFLQTKQSNLETSGNHQESNNIERLNHADPHDFSATIRLLNTFSFDGHFCLVFELLHPKPLHHYFRRIPCGSKKLQLVRKVALRLLQVLGFLRRENVIHADLKPENILCPTEDLSSGVKVIDFGNAIHCIYDELSLYYDDFELQTLLYRAPEVVYGLPFGPEIDMWSVGCILAELYLGEPLFFAVTKEELLMKMVAVLGPLPVQIFQRGKFFSEFDNFIGKPQTRLETQGKLFRRLGQLRDYNFGSFILSILQYNPSERISVSDAFLHPFLASEVAGRFLLPPSSNADTSTYNKINIPASIYTLSPVISSELSADHLNSIDLLRHGTASIQSEPDQAKRPRRVVAEVAPFTPTQDVNVSDSWVEEPVTDAVPTNSAHQTVCDITLKEEAQGIDSNFMGMSPVATVPHSSSSISGRNLSSLGNSSTASLQEIIEAQSSVSRGQLESKECTVKLQDNLRRSSRFNSAKNDVANMNEVTNKAGPSCVTNNRLFANKTNSNMELKLTSKEMLKEPSLSSLSNYVASTSKEICIGNLASHIGKTIEAEYQQHEGLPVITRFKHLEMMRKDTLGGDLEKSFKSTEDSSKWHLKSFREKAQESYRTESSVEVLETAKNTTLKKTPRNCDRILSSNPSHPQGESSGDFILLTPLSLESSTQHLKKDFEESTPKRKARLSRRRLQDESLDESTATNGEKAKTETNRKKANTATNGEKASTVTNGEKASTATNGEKASTATNGEKASTATNGEKASPATNREKTNTATNGENASLATNKKKASKATNREKASTVTNEEKASTATNREKASTATNREKASTATNGEKASTATNGEKASKATNREKASKATNREKASMATNGEKASTVTNGEKASTATNGEKASPATNREKTNTATNGENASLATNKKKASTATNGEKASPATNRKKASKATNREKASTVTNEEKTSTATNGEKASTATNGEKASMATNREKASKATNREKASTATNGEKASMATNREKASKATNREKASKATNREKASMATNGEKASTVTNGEKASTATNGEKASPATNKEKASTATNGKKATPVCVFQASQTRRKLDRINKSPTSIDINLMSTVNQNVCTEVVRNTSDTKRRTTHSNATKASRLTSPISNLAFTHRSTVRKSKTRAKERIKLSMVEQTRWWELNLMTHMEDDQDVVENKTTVSKVTSRREVETRNDDRKDVSQNKDEKEGPSLSQLNNIPSSQKNSENSKTLIGKLTDSEQKSLTEDVLRFESSPCSSICEAGASHSQKMKKSERNVGLKSRTKQDFEKQSLTKLQKCQDVSEAKTLQKPRMLNRKKSGLGGNLTLNRQEVSSKHTVNSKCDLVSRIQTSSSGRSLGLTRGAFEISEVNDSPSSGLSKKRKLEILFERADIRSIQEESIDEDFGVRILPSSQPDPAVELQNKRVKGGFTTTCLQKESHQQLNLSPGNETEMETTSPCSPLLRLSSDNDDEVLLL